jgi:hypothetical protein
MIAHLKSPTLEDIYFYNIVIGALTLILCYLYFKKISQNDNFGFLVFGFLLTSFLFFQISISSEYFLIQWIFILHFFVLLTNLKNNPHLITKVLFFILYLLLILSKVEAFSIIATVPFVLLMFKNEFRNDKTLLTLSYLFLLMISIVTFFIFEDRYLIDNVYQDTNSFRSFIISGFVAQGYLDRFISGCRTIFSHFPSQCLALGILPIISIFYKNKNLFHLSFVLLIFIPIFSCCFFLSRDGFAHQEGGIKFSAQVIFLFTYIWAVTIWNLIRWAKECRIRIIKTLIIGVCVLINIPHIWDCCYGFCGFYNLVKKIKYNPFKEYAGLENTKLFIKDRFVWQIKFVITEGKKRNIRFKILDCSVDDRETFNSIIKPLNFTYSYTPLGIETVSKSGREIFKNFDLIMVINERGKGFDPVKFFEKSPKYEPLIHISSFEREVTVVGYSNRGKHFLSNFI